MFAKQAEKATPLLWCLEGVSAPPRDQRSDHPVIWEFSVPSSVLSSPHWTPFFLGTHKEKQLELICYKIYNDNSNLKK